MFITQGKSNIKYLLIVIVLAIMVGGGILVYQYLWKSEEGLQVPTIKPPEEKVPEETPLKISTLKEQSLSEIDLLRDNTPINIFLFADKETVTVLEAPYCGGNVGAREYIGNYQLISAVENTVISEIDLGRYSFTEDKIHDGLRKFDLADSNETILAIYQYGSCNGDSVTFYRVDDEAKIYQIRFVLQTGEVLMREGTGPTGDIPQEDGKLRFCSYNNAVGKYFCDAYKYNGKDFIQVDSWTEPL